MALFGRISLIVGLIITLVSFVLGFWFMFQDSSQHDLAKMLLMVVPVGFLILFMGLATVVLFSPRENEK